MWLHWDSKHMEESNSEAQVQANAEYEESMFQHVVQNYKGKLMREIGTEEKAKESEKIKIAVKEEHEEKFRKLLA